MGPSVSAPEADTASAVVRDTGTRPTEPTPSDVALVDALLAGEEDLATVLHAVAWSGGWPVRDGSTVTFVHAATTGPWSVAGDFSDWKPVPMTQGEGFFWAQLPLTEPHDGVRYKFTQADTWIRDPWGRAFDYDDFGDISFVAPPQASHLERWPEAEGAGLLPRDLTVYVPAGDGPFPVLYAQDGQNLFDPAAPWGGWQLQAALADPALEPMLVVGLHNTAQRIDDYTPVPDDLGSGPVGGNGDAYADWVHTVVRPHIEATYGSNGHDGLLGSSLGGLISLYIAQRHPGQYDFAASLSGTLGWGRFGRQEATPESRWTSAAPQGTAVYVDSGGGPGPDGVCLDPDGDGLPEDDPGNLDNYCENRQFADVLGAGIRTWNVDLWHWHAPHASHNEAAWAARVGRPLARFAEAAP